MIDTVTTYIEAVTYSKSNSAFLYRTLPFCTPLLYPMIRRTPTEVPLRQEDVADFVARLEEKRSGSSSSTGQPTGAIGSKYTSGQAKQKDGAASSQAVNMIEVNREARAGMTRESRLGM